MAGKSPHSSLGGSTELLQPRGQMLSVVATLISSFLSAVVKILMTVNVVFYTHEIAKTQPPTGQVV